MNTEGEYQSRRYMSHVLLSSIADLQTGGIVARKRSKDATTLVACYESWCSGTVAALSVQLASLSCWVSANRGPPPLVRGPILLIPQRPLEAAHTPVSEFPQLITSTDALYTAVRCTWSPVAAVQGWPSPQPPGPLGLPDARLQGC